MNPTHIASEVYKERADKKKAREKARWDAINKITFDPVKDAEKAAPIDP